MPNPSTTTNSPATPNNAAVATSATAPMMIMGDVDPETNELLLTFDEEPVSEVTLLSYIKSKFTKENLPKVFQIVQSIGTAVADEIKADLGNNGVAATSAVACTYAVTAVQDVLEIAKAVADDQAIQEELIMSLAHLPMNSIKEYYSKSDKSDRVGTLDLHSATRTFKENHQARIAFCKQMFIFLKTKGKITVELQHGIKLELDYTSRFSKRYAMHQFVAVASNVAGGAMAITLYEQKINDKSASGAQMTAMHALQIFASFRLADWYNYCVAQFDYKKVIMHGYVCKIISKFYGQQLFATPQEIAQLRRHFQPADEHGKFIDKINRSIAAHNRSEAIERQKELLVKIDAVAAEVVATKGFLLGEINTKAGENRQEVRLLEGNVDQKFAQFGADIREIATTAATSVVETKMRTMIFTPGSSVADSSDEETGPLLTKKPGFN